MKKVGDIFAELGFNANASDDVKIAFIKNLVRAAYGVEIPGPKPQKAASAPKEAKFFNDAKAPKKLEQLSFDLDTEFDPGADSEFKKAKRLTG